MTETVKINIDDSEYEVPAGMNLIDAARQYAGVDIPVFCYHPKLGFDGNCRMCMVEMGTPRPNRETGAMEIAWFPNPVTACTQACSEGMHIKTQSEKVITSRKAILEFLLSSHPLDCPVCDKGGECPLQNLTMAHGPQTARMYWDDKMRLGKHVPLGDLIFLDRERCIHCARCIRFQEGVAGDPVLGFDYRGRKQQVITFGDPGFDSIFSGNTTDICPVGALTSADFRFNARPWEMVQVATICTHCPVGCNMSFDTRTDREAGGRTTIRRVMPRQNERVNEIWICDKGRFAHHYMEDEARLTTPLMRKGGKLVEATWEEALNEIAAQLKSAGSDIAAIAGQRLSNEDYYALQALVRGLGSNNLDVYPPNITAGDLAAQVGVGTGTNLLDLGKGDLIVVAAGDLNQEAPVWWLRVRAAAKRGAGLIVVNGRETGLDQYATESIRYAYGAEVGALDKVKEALSKAANAVIFVGGEGLDAEAGRDLAQAAANLLIESGHVGRANNGLILIHSGANGQGASDMGFRPDYAPGYQPVEAPGMDYAGILNALNDNSLKLLFIAGADPAFANPTADDLIRQTKACIVVSEMFLTDTAAIADVVLPVQSAAETEGSFTSGERRVQRFYPAIEPVGESAATWWIAQRIGELMGGESPAVSAAVVLADIAANVAQYAGITYQALAQTEKQWPDVSGDDLYYGGTAFTNRHGLGVQWPAAAEYGEVAKGKTGKGKKISTEKGELVAVPLQVLYNTEQIFTKSKLLHPRIPVPHLGLNPKDAKNLGVQAGDQVSLTVGSLTVTAEALLDPRVPAGVVTLPGLLQKHSTLPAAAAATVSKLEKVGV